MPVLTADPVTYPCRSQDVCRLLGITVYRIRGCLIGGKCPPPRKDSAGVFWWTEADVENLRRSLATDRRRREHRGGPPNAA